ncbi:MAG TPA: transcription antitermination factor NusB, partial [Rhizomicrobium sp.]
MNAPRTKARPKSGKSAARLAAVQALYQMEVTGVDADTVIEEFCAHRFPEPRAVPLGEPDERLFRDLVHGVPQHQVEIDRAVANGLSERWKLQRIDSILR